MATSPEVPPAKTIDASRMTLAQVIFPRDTNELDLATAGVILKTIDITASLTAGKHSQRKIVTASLDRMDFVHPAKVWELVTTRACLTKTWRSSMEIEVTVEAQHARSGETRIVAQGYLVFVALQDDAPRSAPVPQLILSTPEEERKAQEAELRRACRLEELKLLGHHHETVIQPDDPSETVWRTMTPDDSNINQNVFGGIILELMHDAAQKAAFRHVNGPVISVRQDRMSFEQPAFIGEEVRAQAIVTRTWTTSLEVQVDVIAKDYKTLEQRLVATSYLVFVAQAPDGSPTRVPPYAPQTAMQHRRWEEADLRYASRQAERRMD